MGKISIICELFFNKQESEMFSATSALAQGRKRNRTGSGLGNLKRITGKQPKLINKMSQHQHRALQPRSSPGTTQQPNCSVGCATGLSSNKLTLPPKQLLTGGGDDIGSRSPSCLALNFLLVYSTSEHCQEQCRRRTPPPGAAAVATTPPSQRASSIKPEELCAG